MSILNVFKFIAVFILFACFHICFCLYRWLFLYMLRIHNLRESAYNLGIIHKLRHSVNFFQGFSHFTGFSLFFLMLFSSLLSSFFFLYFLISVSHYFSGLYFISIFQPSYIPLSLFFSTTLISRCQL